MSGQAGSVRAEGLDPHHTVQLFIVHKTLILPAHWVLPAIAQGSLGWLLCSHLTNEDAEPREEADLAQNPGRLAPRLLSLLGPPILLQKLAPTLWKFFRKDARKGGGQETWRFASPDVRGPSMHSGSFSPGGCCDLQAQSKGAKGIWVEVG